MKALLKRVGECPRFINLSNEYAAFKEILDGEPVAAPLEEGCLVVVEDKTGGQKAKNFPMKNYFINGDALIVSYRHIIFEGITEEEANRVVERYFPEYAAEYRLRGKRGV